MLQVAHAPLQPRTLQLCPIKGEKSRRDFFVFLTASSRPGQASQMKPRHRTTETRRRTVSLRPLFECITAQISLCPRDTFTYQQVQRQSRQLSLCPHDTFTYQQVQRQSRQLSLCPRDTFTYQQVQRQSRQLSLCPQRHVT